MKENLGPFMIAIIISSSCTYVARTMNKVQNAEIQTRNCDLDMSEIDEIVLGHKPQAVPFSPAPSPFSTPSCSIVSTAMYYYDGPIDVILVSNRDPKPNPYAKPISEEELLNWANPLK